MSLVRTLVAALLILLSGEGLVRLVANGPSAQTYDPEIGYSYIPNAELFEAKEGYSRTRFNSLGLNSGEVMPRDERCRILVVGDSYTTALQVPRDENFTSSAARLDPKLDLVNAGRDGLFLGDAHKVVRRLMSSVVPDLVVYVISDGDVNDDTGLPDFHIYVDPSSGEITDAVMKVEGKETFKEVFGPVLQRSALFTRLASQLGPSAATAASMLATARNWWGGSSDARDSTSPAATARPPTEAIVRFVFHRLSESAPTAILYINSLRYLPNHRAYVPPRSEETEAIARAAAAENGITLLDAGPYLISSVERTGQPPFGFNNGLRPGGHLNPQGHDAVAHALVELIRQVRPSLPRCNEK